MAAHSVMILCDMATIYSWTSKQRETYGFHLDCAPGVEEMSLQDWRKLRDLLDEGGEQELKDEIRVVLSKQIQEWLARGKPRTHEDWVKAKPQKSKSELIVEEINRFDKRCRESQYTDIAEAWDLLKWIRGEL